jgi:hypothetical protein
MNYYRQISASCGGRPVRQLRPKIPLFYWFSAAKGPLLPIILPILRCSAALKSAPDFRDKAHRRQV